MDDDVFEERRDTKSTQITNVKRDQVGGKLDTVHYTICTHYFYPENHELIVNLHRLGKIEVKVLFDFPIKVRSLLLKNVLAKVEAFCNY